MGRNNKDFKSESEGTKVDMPGFEGTWSALGSLVKSGEKIVENRKGKANPKK